MRSAGGFIIIFLALVLIYLGATGRLICLKQFADCASSGPKPAGGAM